MVRRERLLRSYYQKLFCCKLTIVDIFSSLDLHESFSSPKLFVTSFNCQLLARLSRNLESDGWKYWLRILKIPRPLLRILRRTKKSKLLVFDCSCQVTEFVFSNRFEKFKYHMALMIEYIYIVGNHGKNGRRII